MIISAAIWFIVGPRVWTDGGWRLHILASQTSVREVIWTPPQPLDGFGSDEQVYEPSISPDGTELYFVLRKSRHQRAHFRIASTEQCLDEAEARCGGKRRI